MIKFKISGIGLLMSLRILGQEPAAEIRVAVASETPGFKEDSAVFINSHVQYPLSPRNDSVEKRVDTAECNRLYRERYEKGKEDLLVTYWESPPIMEKTTIEYADSICRQIDASAYEGRYLVIMILVGENGAPYCSSIWEAGKGLKDKDKQNILYYSNFIRFTPATLRKRPVESVYLFTPRKDKESGRWHCPEMMNE